MRVHLGNELGSISLEELNILRQTARISIASNTTLVILKFLVGFFVGSVNIISEAINSLMGLLAAGINHQSPTIKTMNSARKI
ncbi:MAG: hypothetical protein LUO93_12155 [Methanomicrobiales archaeon]|nr:hypothetical protein [Methanomicrobiales archaeon]